MSSRRARIYYILNTVPCVCVVLCYSYMPRILRDEKDTDTTSGGEGDSLNKINYYGVVGNNMTRTDAINMHACKRNAYITNGLN